MVGSWIAASGLLMLGWLSSLAWHIRGITALAIAFARQAPQAAAGGWPPGPAASLGAKRFPARRLPRADAQVKGRGDPGLEHPKGSCCIRLTLQAEPKSPQLLRLGPTSRWPIHLQPAARWPGQPPVAGTQPRLRLNLQQAP